MRHPRAPEDQFLSSAITWVPLPVQAVKGRDGVDRYAGGSRSIKAEIGEPLSSGEFPIRTTNEARQRWTGLQSPSGADRGGPAHVTWPALGMGR